MRKCWSPAFSAFPVMCSKGLYNRVDKRQDRVVLGEHALQVNCSFKVDSTTHDIRISNV